MKGDKVVRVCKSRVTRAVTELAEMYSLPAVWAAVAASEEERHLT